MSWSMSLVGKNKEAMKAKVNAVPHCPPQVKEIICAGIDAMEVPVGDINGIKVESNGHMDVYAVTATISVSRTIIME